MATTTTKTTTKTTKGSAPKTRRSITLEDVAVVGGAAAGVVVGAQLLLGRTSFGSIVRGFGTAVVAGGASAALAKSHPRLAVGLAAGGAVAVVSGLAEEGATMLLLRRVTANTPSNSNNSSSSSTNNTSNSSSSSTNTGNAGGLSPGRVTRVS